MSVSLPVGRNGRFLALAMLLFALAAIYALAAAPLIGFYGERAIAADDKWAMLARLNAVAAELPELRRRVAELHAGSNKKLTLDGGTDAVALATLQGRMNDIATAAGMTVGSTETLPPQAQGGYRRLGLRLVLSGPYESLLTLIATIETATPPLIVDNLQVHSVQARSRTPTGSGLDASFEIYAFRLDETATAEKR